MLKKILHKLFWGIFRHFVTDKQYAQIRFWLEHDRLPNLENPATFNEKIQYIKLYERTELRKMAADRVRVRSYVKEKIGERYLIPLHGVFDSLTEEAWNSLPSQFVLKANHGCGWVEIVQNKAGASFQKIRNETDKWLKSGYYKIGREWVYKNLPRKLIAEKLILNEKENIPKDFKFFCFNGRVKVIQVDAGRFSAQRRNLYDRHFNRLDAQIIFEPIEEKISRPGQLEKAIGLAETLAKEYSFIRVDLFLPGDDIFFGELTNYPGNGFADMNPPSFEIYLGKFLNIKT